MKRVGETRVREEGSRREIVYGVYDFTPEEMENYWEYVRHYDRDEENKGNDRVWPEELPPPDDEEDE